MIAPPRALILVLMMSTTPNSQLLAQENLSIVIIKGSCTSSFYGSNPITCTNIISMHSANNHRTNFTVSIGDTVISFSGSKRVQHSNQKLDLIIDSILLDKTRLDAWGICNVEVNADASRYRSVRCVGKASQTDFTLQFSGAPGSNVEHASSKPEATRQQPSGRLPFADGTYVTDASLCRLSADQINTKLGDSTGSYVRQINGNRLNDGYELFCTIRNVNIQGDRIRFNAACDSEGEATRINGAWIKIDDRTFRIGQKTYSACGRSIWPIN